MNILAKHISIIENNKCSTDSSVQYCNKGYQLQEQNIFLMASIHGKNETPATSYLSMFLLQCNFGNSHSVLYSLRKTCLYLHIVEQTVKFKIQPR